MMKMIHLHLFALLCILQGGGNMGVLSSPTSSPTSDPTSNPTDAPTVPSKSPSSSPVTEMPTETPSQNPTTSDPTKSPSSSPTTGMPSKSPSQNPTTRHPTKSPSQSPTTRNPTKLPSKSPTTRNPTMTPTTKGPTTRNPTKAPSRSPSKSPTTRTPTISPTLRADRFVTDFTGLQTAVSGAVEFGSEIFVHFKNDISTPTTTPRGLEIPSGATVELHGNGFRFDGGVQTRLITIHPDAFVDIYDLTISNGFAFNGTEIATFDPNSLPSDSSSIVSVNGTSHGIKVFYQSVGGGILNLGEIGTIAQTTFDSNIARSGGAIFNLGQIGSIVGCTFSQNQAYDISPVVGDPLVVRTSVFGDTVRINYDFTPIYYPFEGGGAISQISYLASGAWPPGPQMMIPDAGQINLISGCTFTRNSALQRGGAIYLSGGVITQIVDSTFSDNFAYQDRTWPPAPSEIGLEGYSVLGGAIAAVQQLPVSDPTQNNGLIEEISGCTFLRNNVQGAPGGTPDPFVLAGGAIFCGVIDGVAYPGTFTIADLPVAGVIGTIEDSVFEQNAVIYLSDASNALGGAIAVGGSIGQILRTKFLQNTLPLYNGFGGAIGFIGNDPSYYMFNNLFQGRIGLISGCDFQYNNASSGGAIDTYFGDVASIVGSNFLGNSAIFVPSDANPYSIPGDGGALMLHVAPNFTTGDYTFDVRFTVAQVNGTINIQTSNFSENSANDCAGAICGLDMQLLNLTSMQFVNNSVSHQSAGSGAFHAERSTAYLTSANFTSNFGGNGGAINVESLSYMTITKSNFTSNFAVTQGGAISFQSGSIGIVDMCSFNGNVANSSCQLVSTCDVVGYTCGSSLQNLWEGCADGVGGSIYSSGQLTVRHSTFQNSLIPNVPKNDPGCNSSTCLLDASDAPLFLTVAGLDVYSRGAVLIQDTNFTSYANYSTFDNIAPRATILTCDRNPCATNARCVLAQGGNSVTCLCEGVFANPTNDGYSGEGCAVQPFGSDPVVKLIPFDASEQLPQVTISWVWGPNVFNIQGNPDDFVVYESNTRVDEDFQVVYEGPFAVKSYTKSIDYNTPYYYRVQAKKSGNYGEVSSISSVVISCLPGSIPDDTSCDVCDEGTYQTGLTCVTCPAEFPITTDVDNGATSINDCLTKPSDITIMTNASAAKVRTACPDGAICALAGTTIETVLLKPGYWRSSWHTENIHLCSNADYCWGGNGTGWEWGPNGFGDSSERAFVEGQPGYGGYHAPGINSGDLFNIGDSSGGSTGAPSTDSGNRRELDDDAAVNGLLVPSYCRPYHTGPYCESCLPGYSIRDNFCEECTASAMSGDKQTLAGQIVGVIFGLFAAVFLVLMYNKRQVRIARMKVAAEAAERAAAKGVEGVERKITIKDVKIAFNHLSDFMVKIKIILGFSQVASSFGVTFVAAYPPDILALLDRLSVFNIDFPRYLSFGCTLPTNHYSSLTFYFVAPLILLFMILSSWGVMSFCYRHKPDMQHDLRRGAITGILFVSFLVYPGVSVILFKTFSCETFENPAGKLDGTVSYLRADYTISCNDPARPYWIALASIGVLIYPVGIVAMYLILLYRVRDKLNPKTEKGGWGVEDNEVILKMRDEDPEIAHLKFLFHAYEPPQYYYESVELIRKLSQTSLVIFILEGSASQIVVTMLICFLSLAILYTIAPYVEDDDDNLAVAAQWSLVLASLAALLYKVNVAGTDGYQPGIISLALVLSLAMSPAMALYGLMRTIFTGLPTLRSVFCVCLHHQSIHAKQGRRKSVPAQASTPNTNAILPGKTGASLDISGTSSFASEDLRKQTTISVIADEKQSPVISLNDEKPNQIQIVTHSEEKQKPE